MSLALVGGFLVAIGLCDLLRAQVDRLSRCRQVQLVAVGLTLVAAMMLWVGEGGLAAFGVAAGLGAAVLLWIVGSSEALVATGARAARWRTVAFAGLGLGGLVALLGVGVVEADLSWPQWCAETAFARWPVADAAVAAGAVLLQLATGNVVVRLVLDAVGVPAPSNEKTLKGGRLLGPMERIFIVGLGQAGQVTAAAIVVAAKGLLRFPEIQAGARQGPSDVTEYFLIGSFTSWLVGLCGVALIHLA